MDNKVQTKQIKTSNKKNCSSHGCKICSDPYHTLLHHVQSKPIPNKTVIQIQSASIPEKRTEQNMSEQLNFYTERESATKIVIFPKIEKHIWETSRMQSIA